MAIPNISRTRRIAYRITTALVLFVLGAVMPAVLVFWAALALDVAARRCLLGTQDPYPKLRELLEWDSSAPRSPKTQETP